MNQVCITIGMLSLNVFLFSLFGFNILCRPSCEAVIERYYRNSAPPYLGFNSEIEARTSFESFQTTGQLPSGLFFPASLQPLNGPPVQLPPRTPQRRNRPPTPLSPRTTVSPSSSTLLRSAFSGTAVSSRTTVSPSPSTLPRPALSGTAVRSGSIQCNLVPASTQASQPSGSCHVDDGLSFYVVIEGHAPGIYGSQ